MKTPATVNVSPFFSEEAPAAQPDVMSEEPVCEAPLMSGVEAVNVPVVCAGWQSGGVEVEAALGVAGGGEGLVGDD